MLRRGGSAPPGLRRRSLASVILLPCILVFSDQVCTRFCSIVPVNSAICGNKSKTEDTLSSNGNGVLDDDGEESLQYPQRFAASSSLQNQGGAKSASPADIVGAAKKTQVNTRV